MKFDGYKQKLNYKGDDELQINLTKEQYRKILDAIYISDWVLNSYRLGQGRERFLDEFSQLEQSFFALAEDFGYGDFVEWDNEAKQYFLTMAFDQAMEAKGGSYHYIDEFEEHIFWEALCERLARREIEEQMGCKEFAAKSPFERYRLIEELTVKYHTEFKKNGLKNLRIQKEDKV